METNPLLPRGLKPLVPLEKDPGWDRRQRHITKLTMELSARGRCFPGMGSQKTTGMSRCSRHTSTIHLPFYVTCRRRGPTCPTGNLR